MKYLLTILLALAISLPLSAQDTTAKKSSFWTMGDDKDYDTHHQYKGVVPIDSIFPMVNGKIIYTDIFNVPDTSINNIYLKVKLWFADNFRDAKSVIQVDDKDNGIIKGKGVWDFGANHYFYYTITVKFKVGKVKYEITDILHIYDGYISGYGYMKEEKTMENWLGPKKKSWFTPSPTKQQTIDSYNRYNSHFIDIITSLKKALTIKEDTDW